MIDIAAPHSPLACFDPAVASLSFSSFPPCDSAKGLKKETKSGPNEDERRRKKNEGGKRKRKGENVFNQNIRRRFEHVSLRIGVLRLQVNVRVSVCVFWRFPETKRRKAASRRAPSRCQTVDFPLSWSTPYITDPPFSPDTMTCVIYQTGPCQGFTCACRGAHMCLCVKAHMWVSACRPVLPSASEVHSSGGRKGVRDGE